MGSLQGKILSTLGNWATKLESWLALGSMIVGWGFLTWLSNQWTALAAHGWAAVALFSLAATCVVILVMSAALAAWRYFKPIEKLDLPIDPALVAPDPAHDMPDPDVYYRLFQFCWQYLLEACDAQIELQKQMLIASAGNNMILAHYATLGLEHNPNTEKFLECYETLKIGVETSEPMLKYGALVDLVRNLERGTYREFCEHASMLMPGYDLRADKRLKSFYEGWRTKHNALIEAYDDEIKCDPRFGKKLFWPKRESRWGGIIPPLLTDSPTPEDTPAETQQ